MRHAYSVALQLLLLFLTGWTQSALGGFEFDTRETVWLDNDVKDGDLAEVQRKARCRYEKGTLLHLAVELKIQNPQIIEILLSSGINPNAYSSEGLQALHYTARRPNSEIVKLLLDHGADPNGITEDGAGLAPLHFAAAYGNTAVLEVLLDADADMEQPNLKKLTPLEYTFKFGNVNAARFLLEAGADPMPVLRDGVSPKDIICPCRADFSCKLFSCSLADVHALEQLLEEKRGKEPAQDSDALSPIERLAQLQALLESGK